MQSTLVILAAGMASRYGSMKQTQSFGPSGETIMAAAMPAELLPALVM